MLNHLPLSWVRANVSKPQFKTITLPLSRLTWIPTAEIPFDHPFEQIYHNFLGPLPQGFAIQFCNETLSRFLVEKGGQAVQIGVEGVLPLQQRDLTKPSLLNLARRGQRWGRVTEIPPTLENKEKLQSLIKKTPHATKPQLAFAFRSHFDNAARCFVFITPDSTWLGAITLSLINRHYVHTELILRHKNAPVGIMDALVVTVFNRLKTENLKFWSLGSVPFVLTDRVKLPQTVSSSPAFLPDKTKVIKWSGRTLKFAYNYEGLFNFKNKFTPRWQPVYLCASPRLSWRALVDLAGKMRYLHLVGHRVYTSILHTN